MLEYFTDEIIKSSLDNSAGTLLNRKAINLIIGLLIESRNLSKDNVDKLIEENGTEYGYMVKFSDFEFVLRNSIMGDNLQIYFEPEKPEKDLEIIEVMYGDWHSECGDR